MRKIVIFNSIFFLIILLSSCSTLDSVDKAMVARANRQMDEADQEYRRAEKLWQDYIGNVMYVSMPKDEFKLKFEKNIDKDIGEIVYFLEPESNIKARAVFQNNLLVKYERYGLHYGIWGTGGYYDCTSWLQG